MFLLNKRIYWHAKLEPNFFLEYRHDQFDLLTVYQIDLDAHALMNSIKPICANKYGDGPPPDSEFATNDYRRIFRTTIKTEEIDKLVKTILLNSKKVQPKAKKIFFKS